MIYQQFQNLRLSALGLGAMRLPRIGTDQAQIDEAKTAEMVAYAMEHGINYYDTAWAYHGGNSETVLGRVLSAYPRERFCLASKFPGYDAKNLEKCEEIFEKQLEKCGVDYFDFYLFHNVSEKNVDGYLDERYGLYRYLMEQKRQGRIRHLGFSTHGSLATMRRFLDAYGEGMEFCQIQLNYLDWTLQDAKAKVELLQEYGLPVWVMEPVRGGMLATLPEADAEALRRLRPEEGVPAWAFRFLQSVPGVTMILSGMSNMEQLQDNVQTFQTHSPLNEAEMSAILAVAERMMNGTQPCTACQYCVEYCPQQIPIPKMIARYNEAVVSGSSIPTAVLSSIPEESCPTACVGCHSCEAVCPQEIRISQVMVDFAARIKA